MSEFIDLVLNPAHWLFGLVETLVVDVLVLGMALPFIARWVRRHDAKRHGDGSESA